MSKQEWRLSLWSDTKFKQVVYSWWKASARLGRTYSSDTCETIWWGTIVLTCTSGRPFLNAVSPLTHFHKTKPGVEKMRFYSWSYRTKMMILETKIWTLGPVSNKSFKDTQLVVSALASKPTQILCGPPFIPKAPWGIKPLENVGTVTVTGTIVPCTKH